MAALARLFDWKNALVVVKPDTLVRWHRKGFRLFWRWKSRHKGRPHDYRFVIFDRDTKVSDALRKSVRAMGVRVLRTPPFAPQANCYFERLIGTTRRECLDFLVLRPRSICVDCWVNGVTTTIARGCIRLSDQMFPSRRALEVNPAPHRHQVPSAKRMVSTPVLWQPPSRLPVDPRRLTEAFSARRRALVCSR